MKYYTLKEAAVKLGWRESKVRDWIRKGYLQAQKGGVIGLLPKLWYVSADELRRVCGE